MKTPLLTQSTKDGFRIWTFDQPRSSANVLGVKAFDALERELDLLENKEVPVSGLLIRSAKPGVFLAGADLKELHNFNAKDLEAMVERGQGVFERLAALPFPTVCLIDGVCLGGGYELALACDIRTASRGAKLGFTDLSQGMIIRMTGGGGGGGGADPFAADLFGRPCTVISHLIITHRNERFSQNVYPYFF